MSNQRHNAITRQNARQHAAHLKQMLHNKALTKNHESVDPQPVQQTVYAPRTVSALRRVEESARGSLPAASPRNRTTLRSTDEHLQRSTSHVAHLILQTKRLSELNRIFLAFLPTYLHDHASLAKLDTDGWVVQTDSPVWATRLRYILPSLQKPLSEKLNFQIPPPRIRIAPPAVPLPPAPRTRRMKITDSTAKVLEGAARNLPDRRLGAVMARLATHAKQRSQES